MRRDESGTHERDDAAVNIKTLEKIDSANDLTLPVEQGQTI